MTCALLRLVAPLFLATMALARPAAALEFAPLLDAEGKSVLYAQGAIEPSDVADFSRVMSANPDIKEIWLFSGGGNINASFEIGRIIRRAKLTTRVPSEWRLRAAIAASPQTGDVQLATARLGDRPFIHCSSACGMILAGGVERHVDEPFSVGVHSASAMNNAAAIREIRSAASAGDVARLNNFEKQHQQLGVLWTTYMQEMGVALSYVNRATEVPSGCMYFLSAAEMVEMRVTTGPVSGTASQKPQSASGKAGYYYPNDKACS